jgi:hypothetical protein
MSRERQLRRRTNLALKENARSPTTSVYPYTAKFLSSSRVLRVNTHCACATSSAEAASWRAKSISRSDSSSNSRANARRPSRLVAA